MNPEKLINWCELSRILSGSRSVVISNRMPKKHEEAVNELKIALNKWWENRNSPTTI